MKRALEGNRWRCFFSPNLPLGTFFKPFATAVSPPLEENWPISCIELFLSKCDTDASSWAEVCGIALSCNQAPDLKAVRAWGL